MDDDPIETNPTLYRVVMENERVRVLEYRDRPGDRTMPHRHPDSVMITLSGFQRRLTQGDRVADVVLEAGLTRWIPEQEHAGENIGTTETHALFVELKEVGDRPSGRGLDESSTAVDPGPPIGPSAR